MVGPEWVFYPYGMKDDPMLKTTHTFPIIALAGTISFIAALTSFTVSARAQATRPVPIAAPLPGFTDPYNRTPILGYTPGESQIRLANLRDEGVVTNTITIYGLDEKKVL